MERKNRMLKSTAFLIFAFLHFVAIAQNIGKDIDYIKTYASYAVEEMELYKIPASITLSQGLLETAFGQSELAKNTNNHFGIKCKIEWRGETYRYTDDAYKECFRKYNNPRESYRDHSLFLAERPYYKDLFYLDQKDYKAWAHGLKKAGYATNPKYAELLIARIENYKLDRFDYLKLEEVEQSLKDWFSSSEVDFDSVQFEEETEEIPNPEPQESKPKENTLQNTTEADSFSKIKIRHITGNYYTVVQKGETIEQIAKRYNLKPSFLLKINELIYLNKPIEGQYIFLRPKKRYGGRDFHEVKNGETMYMISQIEGLKLKSLYGLNRMKFGFKPKIGQKLRLR